MWNVKFNHNTFFTFCLFKQRKMKKKKKKKKTAVRIYESL